jgi:hypothetical protein
MQIHGQGYQEQLQTFRSLLCWVRLAGEGPGYLDGGDQQVNKSVKQV